ncbi:MAG: peptidoglycan DD-metalloendopeptidase family protein [Thiobacillus sp.]|nr:peptidoglycan DD-metalloendopeptidase family protein [Thiobacillus sp.]
MRSGPITFKPFALGSLLLGLAGCVAYSPAPVSDRGSARGVPVAAKTEPARPATPQIAPSTTGFHTVQRGDTLYAIAFANSLDYRDVAGWNQLESADRILVGQTLRLTPPAGASVPGGVEIRPLESVSPPTASPLADATPVLRTPQAVLLPYSEANWAQVSSAPAATTAASRPEDNPPAPSVSAPAPVPPAPSVPAPAPEPPTASASAAVDSWIWPAEGTLTGRFGAAGGKGIDIVGVRNTPVKAVAPGKVVYSGSGLRGYGQLLIVKHAGEFLSAYAHNETILVKEGDTVAAGQKIALMGDSDADRVKLHFEIRRYGKPLDPLNYLPERS